MATHDRGPLLVADDPAPVIHSNPAGQSPFLLIGDHAGRAIPRTLGSLGLGQADLARHIACDIGISALGTALAERIDAVFLHQAYSRLVIDCNRDPASPDAIPEISDGTTIPANQAIDRAARAERVARIHAPYHHAIAREIARRAATGQPTILVSLHSFTPVMAGFARPWHAGILHDGAADAFARAVLAALAARRDIVVGDNEPYRMDDTDHTVPRHAFAAQIPYVEIEVRQDLIGDDDGVARWRGILGETFARARGG